ncbi:MAG TPA: Mur ligase family protein [Acidimicrobiia bacterium]|nr:Mur ligase family protein [Acidimicrobiia bacterium]
MSGPGSFDAPGWLSSHVNLESLNVPAGSRRGPPTLERISTLMQYLGSPEIEFPAIHVTGTNGKTTTVRVLTELLSSLGLKVGAYTSPHLEHVNERMSIDGVPIDDDTFEEMLYAVSLVEQSVGVDASYFEIVTAAAFRWFADEAVDVAVVEVGMGGEWDATNVVDGRVAVVTNVTIDHVEYLGPTRKQIAQEKAGIVKPDSILVLGETDPDLQAIFEARPSARTFRRDIDFGVARNVLAIGGRLVDLRSPGAEYPDVFLPLHGAHQSDNAAIALAAAESFVTAPLPFEVVADAFARVQSPGRLEVVRRQPLVLLDGAHNVAGAHALRAALDEEWSVGPRTIVVGMLREKEPHEMLSALGVEELEGMLICCRPPTPRALEPSFIAKAASDLGLPEERIEIVERVEDAVSTAMLATPPDGQIVITGSLYVVGAARSVLVS